MKKILFIFILSFKLFSQDVLSVITNVMNETSTNLDRNILDVVNSTMNAEALSNQTNPLPPYMLNGGYPDKIMSVFFNFTFSTVIPFLNLNPISGRSDYSSSLQNVFNNKNNFTAFNVGMQFYLRDNRPVRRRFVFRFGYNVVASDRVTNLVYKISPYLKENFTGDDVFKIGMDLHKIDLGMDVYAYDSRFLDIIFGICYTFVFKNINIDSTIKHTIKDVGAEISSLYSIGYRGFTHSISLPITFNFNILDNKKIKYFIGYSSNIIFYDDSKLRSSISYRSLTSVQFERTASVEMIKKEDIFQGKLYTGFYFYFVGFEFYYRHNPKVLGFNLFGTVSFGIIDKAKSV